MEQLRRLNLWTSEERRSRADLTEVYKKIHGLTTVMFESFFEFENYSRTRDHYFQVKKSRSAGMCNTFFYRKRN